jgi:hypothetical protein
MNALEGSGKYIVTDLHADVNKIFNGVSEPRQML